MNNKNYCEYCGEESAVLFKYKTYIENIEHYCPSCYIYVNFGNLMEELKKDDVFRFVIPNKNISNTDAKCNCGETENLTEIEENGNIKYYCGYCYRVMRYEQFIEEMEKEVNTKIKEKVDIKGVMEQYIKDRNDDDDYH